MLGLALLVLSLSGQQVLTHFQQISLDERRLHRQLATEQLFDEVALSLEMNGRMQLEQGRGYVAHAFNQGSPGQRVLYSETQDVPCPHDFFTLSMCWRIQVRQSGSGFIRERMLVIPEASCASSYWFPPEGRVVSAPVLPPADAPPESDPPPELIPEPTPEPTPPPRPGGGLRP
ncbi:MAG: hypothetical protein JJU03_10970 [Idiomarina sp.]|nr:hypothetical protein [Idiomarina sp.]